MAMAASCFGRAWVCGCSVAAVTQFSWVTTFTLMSIGHGWLGWLDGHVDSVQAAKPGGRCKALLAIRLTMRAILVSLVNGSLASKKCTNSGVLQ